MISKSLLPVVIIAGGVPRAEDPLFAYTQGASKALIDLHGRPMIEYVIQSLQGSEWVGDLAIVGLPPETVLDTLRPVRFLPDQNSLVGNGLAGISYFVKHHQAKQLLLCAADIPLLTSPIVNQFMAACQPFDHALYYPITPKQTMENHFPGASRTYSHLREGDFAGGDLILVKTEIAGTNPALWHTLANARKYPWKMARTIGFDILLKFLLHRLSIHDVETKASKLIGLPVKAILFPQPELAMDADKPHQIELVRNEISKQKRRSPTL